MALVAVLAAGGISHAQLLRGAPVGGILNDLGGLGAGALGEVQEVVRDVPRHIERLSEARRSRLLELVRANRDALEMAPLGPAVRGEIVVVDPSPAVLAKARAAGFAVTADELVEGLDIRSVTFRPPAGQSLEEAMARLRQIAPDAEFSPNYVHLQSGSAGAVAAAGALATGAAAPGGPKIGMIDGGVGQHSSLGAVDQRGFATGAPLPSGHGTAVASLVVGTGTVRGSAPGAALLVADIYGRDPKGGNALAIARALGWMAQNDVRVVAMSLTGPPNPLVAKAVAQARARGMYVVAPVGNDGPAAPPAYPASYPGVIAVTGVDGRNRPLIEAGRSLHLDYAAPGSDMAAAAPGGGLKPVRGTSFAVPLVAGRLARSSLAALDAEAKDLGRKGPDNIFGRGLVCGDCRTSLPKK
ncbi:S8 family serine peptidase [Sphingosinicella sp. LY1275]|uniref:S8 family serine peptidase n=1 Tax=Sphingosinicella sp. LY1275 TaxID=3095379 RepID=UPI002ADEAC81|nr:S8 family serine peptidase [Sphingosinicella sp. LY1275]MEA1015763.1 S8 family serine peptidase [Sphingosinicella sp. LY1275]